MSSEHVLQQDVGSLFAKGNFSKGMKWAIFEKWSTTVRIVVILPDGGRPVKSIVM